MIPEHYVERIDQYGEIHQVLLYQSWKELPRHLLDRHRWSLQGRKPTKSSVPQAGLILPAEPYGQQHIKFFYAQEQTEPYRNQFVQDLHRFLGWFSPYRYDFIRHPDDHTAKFKHANRRWGWKDIGGHILGQQQIGVIGNQFARYLLFDGDYHPADPRWELFLARCKVLYSEIPALAHHLRATWFVECRQEDISGVRFILLLPHEVWIPKLRQPAERFLKYLDGKYPRLASIESFQKIELFPVLREKDSQGKGCRLPLGVDITAEGIKPRVTITDRFLLDDPKSNLRQFVAWVDGGGGNNLSLDLFLKFLVQNTPRHETPTPTPRASKKPSRKGPGKMGELPYPLKGNLKRLLKEFKEGAIPPDTIGKFIAIVTRLVHYWGGDPEEVLRTCMERWQAQGVDTSFSDRLSCNEGELWRVFGYLVEAVENGNGYQPRPEESTGIFKAVVQRWRECGFDPVAYLLADDAELPVTAKLDISDVSFTFKYPERLVLKDKLHPILQGRSELDIGHTYACAQRIVAFARKYPHREFACEKLLPILCADLPITWHKNKCYAVMRCLLDLGFLRVRLEYQNGRTWLWRGHLPQFNRARTFELGEVVGRYFQEKTAESPLPRVSIISHPGRFEGWLNEAAWQELEAEGERLRGRVPIRRCQMALV